MLGVLQVVVPLDGSPQANAALPIAVALAAPLGADMLLVRAVPTPRDMAVAQRALDAVAREVRGNEVATATRVVLGDAAHEIPSLLGETDLVVLGLAGRPDFGALTRSLLGGSAPVVLRRAGGRRVRRIARVGAEAVEPAASFARDLAARLAMPGVPIDLDDAEACAGVDLLVVDRERAALALDPTMAVPLLVL